MVRDCGGGGDWNADSGCETSAMVTMGEGPALGGALERSGEDGERGNSGGVEPLKTSKLVVSRRSRSMASLNSVDMLMKFRCWRECCVKDEGERGR